MRWVTSRLQAEDGERGATMVLVAFLLVVLLGFAGLAVDGAATMAKEQELQNGADAAALAAAQECADSGCGGAPGIASPYAVDNVRDEKLAVSSSFAFDISAQTVKATVSGTKTHWFLPVLGISSTNVIADATAAWGSPAKGPAMLPLSVSMCSFEEAVGDPDLDVAKDIFLNKNGSEDDECTWGGAYPAGGFGWLEGSTSDCEVDVTVDSWVVADPGMDEPGCDWASMIGKTVLIPVFSDRTEPSEGKNVWVEQFAAFQLLGIKPSNGSPTIGAECGPRPAADDYHNACIRGIFKEYVSTAEGYDTGDEDTEVTVITLID